MKHFIHEIAMRTRSPIEFIDITSDVRDASVKSGVRNGLVTVLTRHTTTAIKINERCERLQADMEYLLKRIVPEEKYRHDEKTVDNKANGRSHLMSILLNASETMPVVDGKLSLGNWQSVFFVELDGPRAERKFVVTVVGE